MKSQILILATLSLSLVSCDKIKTTMVNQLEEEIKKSDLKPIPPYEGTLVTQLTDISYDGFVSQRGRLIVIDFYADWCAPCRQLSPILDSIAAEKGGQVLVGKVDVEQFKQLAMQQGVQGIPDVRLYKNGKEVDRFKGYSNEAAVREKIESHMVGLPPIIDESKMEPSGNPDEPNKPATKPMNKDWLPPGVEKRAS